MSMRFLMGMVQALVVPGKRMAASISSTQLFVGDVIGPDAAQGSRLEPFGRPTRVPARLGRHSAGGFSSTTVSTIDRGAGSVDVSARQTHWPPWRHQKGT